VFKQHVNTPRYAKDAATKLYVDELGVKLQTAIDDAIDTIPPPLDAYTKTEADIRYVNVAGDTMTGDLTINKADAQIHLKKTAGTGAYITTYNGSLPRWSLQLGNVTAESGANAGSDFALLRFSDAGALVDAPELIGMPIDAIEVSPQNGLCAHILVTARDAEYLGRRLLFHEAIAFVTLEVGA